MKYDLNEIAKDMLEWSLTEDATCILNFTFDKDYRALDISDWARDDAEFSAIYAKVQERIGKNRSDRIQRGEMNNGDYHRQQGFYHKTLRNYEREEKKLDAELALKKKEQEDKDYIEKLGNFVERKDSSDYQ